MRESDSQGVTHEVSKSSSAARSPYFGFEAGPKYGTL